VAQFGSGAVDSHAGEELRKGLVVELDCVPAVVGNLVVDILRALAVRMAVVDILLEELDNLEVHRSHTAAAEADMEDLNEMSAKYVLYNMRGARDDW